MPIMEILKNYLRLITTEHFAKYERDFARNLQIELIEGYNQALFEPDMVSIIERIINNLNDLSISVNGFKISTKSIFIHGKRSQVEFEYFGQKVQRELGDLIFILSIIYNGKKYFEKFTISQFKKDNNKSIWDLSNKEQIYLLSRFPPFHGIRGSIVPMKEFYLPNYSGCLGSFNLLFRPGDFVFVSAPQLEFLLGNKKTLNINDITKLWASHNYYIIYHIYHNWKHIEKLFSIWSEIWKINPSFLFFPFYSIGILGFSLYAYNIHDFVDKYLRGHIGELNYSHIGIYNKPAFDFLQELLSAIMIKAKKEKIEELEDFVNEFFGHAYSNNEGGIKEARGFDFEGGGIGIIYTSINLGEGNK